MATDRYRHEVDKILTVLDWMRQHRPDQPWDHENATFALDTIDAWVRNQTDLGHKVTRKDRAHFGWSYLLFRSNAAVSRDSYYDAVSTRRSLKHLPPLMPTLESIRDIDWDEVANMVNANHGHTGDWGVESIPYRNPRVIDAARTNGRQSGEPLSIPGSGGARLTSAEAESLGLRSEDLDAGYRRGDHYWDEDEYTSDMRDEYSALTDYFWSLNEEYQGRAY